VAKQTLSSALRFNGKKPPKKAYFYTIQTLFARFNPIEKDRSIFFTI
jgi:hypothetical protein